MSSLDPECSTISNLEIMQKCVKHLIAIEALTRNSLPLPLPVGTSLKSVVKTLYEEWKNEGAGLLHIRSPILFETLLEHTSQQSRGIFPVIAKE